MAKTSGDLADEPPRALSIRTTGPLPVGELEARRAADEYFGGAQYRLVSSCGGRETIETFGGGVIASTYVCDWEFEAW